MRDKLPQRWGTLSPLLDELLDLDDAARAARLAQHRGADPRLAAELAELLALQAQLDDEAFLEGSPPLPPQAASLAGQRIGAYTLVEPIGSGGMGSVWLARRSDGRYEGDVAVKLLNLALVAKGGPERFAREGHVLARLSHPNIAHLIDAGVSDGGQPYLVLEHVRGEPIDRHCEMHGLDIDARVRLLLQVLAAVEHAHGRLVLHRDLKPGNILVTDDGRIKLLDFGIAKLLDDADAAAPPTALTQLAGRAFTPEFAAPEQVQGGDVTAATDVYALGVLMYLLLSGAHPTAKPTDTPVDRLRSVVEIEPPRLSEAALRAQPRRSAALRGDLDNIAAKALKKAPAERYASVAAFAGDLQRWLADEPVSARADTWHYRAAKFVRRHRVGVAAASLTAASLVAGIVGTLWQAREAGKQRDIALTQLGRAVATNEFMTFLLSAAAPPGKAFSVSDLLEQGQALADKQFADNAALQSETLAGIAEHHMAAERWDKAVPLLERAAAIAGRQADPAVRARALCPLAMMQMAQGRAETAEATMRSALDSLPDEPEHALQRAQCLIHASSFGFFNNQAEPTIRHATAAIELLERTSIPTTLKDIDGPALLAYGYYLARRNREADAVYERLMASLERLGRARTTTAAAVLNNWGLVHYLGQIVKSEPLYRRAIELRRSIEGAAAITPSVTHNHAGALRRLARYDEARQYFEATIRNADERQEHRVKFDAMMELADLHVETGDIAAAMAQLESVKSLRSHPAFDARRSALLAYHQGRVALALRDAERARSEFVAAVTSLEKGSGGKFAVNVLALIGLAQAEQALGARAAALAALRRALALAESFVEPGAPSYLIGLCRLAQGDVEQAAGEPASAQASFDAALLHLRQSLGDDHPAVEQARRKRDALPALGPGASPSHANTR